MNEIKCIKYTILGAIFRVYRQLIMGDKSCIILTVKGNTQDNTKYKGENKMSTVEITSKIDALKDLETLIEEAKAEAEALRDEIKAEMLSRNTEEMEAGLYIVRWTSVLTQRFDTTAFKKVMPEVYKEYTKQVSSRRFSIA